MMIVGVLFFGWLISSISDLLDVRACLRLHAACLTCFQIPEKAHRERPDLCKYLTLDVF